MRTVVSLISRAMFVLILVLSVSIASTIHGQGMQKKIIIDGTAREYILHLPPSYNKDAHLPLVIALHGINAFNHELTVYTGLPDAADKHGYIAVFPQGIHAVVRGSLTPQWDSQFGTETNDVKFISELIDSMVGLYGADARRVYVTGFSNGGFMAYRLICELSEKIAAVAPVAALMPIAQKEKCKMSHNVPILQFQNGKDFAVPPTGIPEFMLNLDDTLAYFSKKYLCNNIQSRVLPDLDTNDHIRVSHTIYTGCKGGGALEHYFADNAEHTWPGALYEAEELGRLTRDINATEQILSFFSRYQLPKK